MKTITLILFISLGLTSYSQTQNCNCCSENYDDFDFWVGEWTVTNPQGNHAGNNTLEKIQDNCVLRENWRSANGKYTGTSYNFYNSLTKKWEQIWVDNNGGNLYLSGNRIDNQMILRSADLTDQEGKRYFHRITWTHNEDGTVRQYWETIKENGDITVAFDGLYSKVQ